MPGESNPVRNDIVSLLVVGFTAAPLTFLAVHYPDMPARVPVHWDIHGLADRWAAKSFLAVFFAPILSVLLQVMLALLTSDLANAVGAVQGTDEASGYKRASLQANLSLMQPLRLLLAAMLCVIAFLEPLNFSAPRAGQWASVLLLFLVAALLLVTLLGVVKVIRLQRKWQSAAPSQEPEFQAENWRWGAFYYNPDDPNFLVHKRLGAGFTLNFAHPRAKLHALLLAATIAFTFVATAKI
ncbi:MAG: DUF1648 domain-containing protein [Bryobacterales bacterium]|nr:DUF1648 domain-containing protein [Bryobacterales bacterium]